MENKDLKIGDEITYERIFTKDDLNEYMHNSKVYGKHHKVPNENGEYLLHGLLTASLATKLGGDYNILVYKMIFDFKNKAYTDRLITAKNIIKNIYSKGDKNFIDFSCVISDKDIILITSKIYGILLDL